MENTMVTSQQFRLNNSEHKVTNAAKEFGQQQISDAFYRKQVLKKGAPELALNTICPYYTMFPLSFPYSRLRKAEKDARVIDPFCGRGTTLFAARLLGLSAVGIDSNPMAAAISAAKLLSVEAAAVTAVAAKIIERSEVPFEMPEGLFWEQCYHQETLRDICKIRESLLRSCSTPEEVMLRALMLGVLHGPIRKGSPSYLSNQMPRTYAMKPEPAVRYWTKKGMNVPKYIDVLETIRKRANYSLKSLPGAVKGAIYCGDSRQADQILKRENKFSWVITSPPYFGMRSYLSDQWLRNWFLGGTDSVDYCREGQLTHVRELFVKDLAAVWRSIARVCHPGTKMIVRFGSISSETVDACEVFRMSLKMADAGWKLTTRKDAGTASLGNRQSEQFKCVSSNAAPEYDFYARLEV